MVDKVKIHGLENIRRRLRALPKAVAKKELNRALAPGARIIANKARKLAPSADQDIVRMLRGKWWLVQKDNLKKSIRVANEKKKFLRNTAMKRVGVLSDKRNPNIGAWYWRFVEFGTIKMKARPFLSTAFDQMKYQALAAIKKKLLEGVERQAKAIRHK